MSATGVLVQYIIVRKDLAKTWPLGALLAQGCHACVAAVWASRESAATAAYLAPGALETMHKVVLGAESQEALLALSRELAERGVAAHLWVEQPEGVPTCLATAPGAKDVLAPHFAGLKLLR